ncbi:aldehyde dehydrogenase family protein [Streptomyces sp. CO7]
MTPAPFVRQHIAGAWVDSRNGRTYESLDPWSGEVVAVVAAGDQDDARDAIEAADRAFAGWSRALPHERQSVLLRAADVVERRRAEILALLARETGCTRHFGDVQLDFALSLLRQSAALPYAADGQLIPSDRPGTRSMAIRRPVGVVGAIAPWNAALALTGRAIVGPLALGNTVVLKPSQEAPACGALWAEIFAEAGLPPGVLNVVTHAPGDASLIGDELIANPLVRRLSFTGSTATGRRLAEAAGRHLKRILLQLGGQNPMIVLDGVDLDHAAAATAYGAFVHQGQVCMGARRIFVERPIADAFLERLAAKVSSLPMGSPLDPATVIGPVINQWALSTIGRRVEEAVAAGARIVAGGRAAPPCYPATVLTDVPEDIELALDETFGPVVVVTVVEDRDEAVARANASGFGLAAAVLAADSVQGLEVARRIDAGIVHVNDQPVNDEPQMPFGGTRDSGWGRFGVGFVAEDFTELQWVTTRDTPRAYPF